MKVSLNDLASILTSRVGQALNPDLLEEVKVILNYKRALFFKRLIEQHPEQRRFFYKEFTAPVRVASPAECPVEYDRDCEVFVTQSAIPLPVRSSYALFDYLGSATKEQPFGYATPEQAKLYSKYNRYTSREPKYYYANGKVFVYNAMELENVGVRGIFDDPRQLAPFKCNNVPCYTDNDQYDIPSDLINDMIKDTLQTELRNQFPPMGKVELDKSDNPQ